MEYTNNLIKNIAPNIVGITVIWGLINCYPIFAGAGVAIYYITKCR
jgi:hypothetical protein